MQDDLQTDTFSPPARAHQSFTDAKAAVDLLEALYAEATEFLAREFVRTVAKGHPGQRVRAYYPEIRLTVVSFDKVDSRLSFGHVASPGTYATTVTRPDLFRNYLIQQIALLIENHGVSVDIGPSDTPIPIHFAMAGQAVPQDGVMDFSLRDVFDVPDLATTNDDIVNGTLTRYPDGSAPLAPFTAQRVDYSLARLAHYTATDPEHFQNHVLFTNYQFYVDEFEAYARAMLSDVTSGYTGFVATGNQVITTQDGVIQPTAKMPQMPTYHLKRADGNGITLVNIGVGPSNAKTATDHIAVLRPHAWLMLGHCAGLRRSQQLGDYVLAHGYLREDSVLDLEVPPSVPIPPIAEVQVALQEAVVNVTGLAGAAVKTRMRTGTVATTANRNWELRYDELFARLNQSRSIAVDMESATIATNGFRFRVPYGTLLCVSDKPLHGELKLRGMANTFYRERINQHLQIGLEAIRILREEGADRLHSRKLRSFDEPAFR